MKNIVSAGKHILRTLAVAALAVMAAGCNDFLDINQRSRVDAEDVFKSVAYARLAVIGSYVPLAHNDTYGQKFHSVFDADNDCLKKDIATSKHSENHASALEDYDYTISNSELNGPWDQLYDGVACANNCIQGILGMDMYYEGTAQEQKDLRALLGEAYTLRALYYSDLIRLWGDVPFVQKPVGQNDDVYVTRTQRDIIYDSIIAQVARTVDYMPETTSNERFSRYGAKALLARICMNAAGYSLRWDLNANNVASLKMRLRSVSQSDLDNPDNARIEQLYQIAAKQCADIIESGKHNLNPDFENIFQRNSAKQSDPFGEIMAQVAMYSIDGTGRVGTILGPSMYDGTIETSDFYYGEPKNDYTFLPTLLFSYGEGDQRRDVTVFPFQYHGINKTYYLQVGNKLPCGKYRVWWKSVTMANKLNTNINWILMRYSDVLLLYAESCYRLGVTSYGDCSITGLEAFNRVRRRAYKVDVATAAPAVDFTSIDLVKILEERKLEFAGEAYRKQDLIRFNKLGDAIWEVRERYSDNAKYAGSNTATNTPLDPSHLSDAVYAPVKSTPASYSEWKTGKHPTIPNPAYISAAETPNESKTIDDPKYTSANWGKGFSSQCEWPAIDGRQGSGYTTSTPRGVGFNFEYNYSEILPIGPVILSTNPKLKQRPLRGITN